MANAAYNRGKFYLSQYKWASETPQDIGVILVTAAYTFSADHNTVADLTNEISGTGYVRKLINATARTVNENDTSDSAELRVTDGTVVWTGLDSGTGLRPVLFVESGTLGSSTHLLLGYIDTGTGIPITSNGGDVTLNFNTAGAINLA
jgi:hypothetical protein